MSDSTVWRIVNLGDVAVECNLRAEDAGREGTRVYGVDRHEGLTPNAKYTSKDLSRYKVIRPGMFAYNPMRLNIGSIAYCSQATLPGLVSPDYVVFSCKAGALDPEFLKYAIKGHEWMRWTTAAGVGSVRVRIYFKELTRLPLTLPSIIEQRAIARILGSLDDKIELNRRMNETLEGLTRALFQSWFVDFDPVRAKASGQRPPGLTAATAALFPDHFEHQNDTLIPTGWSMTNLGCEVDLFTGFPFKSKEYIDSQDSIRLVRGDNVVQGRLRWASVKRWPSHLLDGLDDYQLQKGDVVLAMDRPWIDAGLKYAWIGDHDLPCLLVQRVARLRSNGAGIGTGFTRLLIGSPQFTQHVLAVLTGTAVPHISGTQIKSFEFVLPSAKDRRLLQHFEQAVAPLLDRFDSNNGESDTLGALRDMLLPKLLSGELRVRDAEELVEETA